ncbi:DUF4399 domain-containing protein [Mariprofundus ferrooxydans]|nr:DUF4399 domain-containing protein [Mariprofundus ferrooxydans]
MKLKRKWIAVAALVALPLLQACSQAASSSVEFVQPKDGATVSGTVNVVMAVRGMKVHKAGAMIADTGHHHIIIDGAFVPKGDVVAKDATHKHFGKGQTETLLNLTPGDHTLTLQFADGHHQSYGKAMSQTITVHVK